jgi:hypothetical protein
MIYLLIASIPFGIILFWPQAFRVRFGSGDHFTLVVVVLAVYAAGVTYGGSTGFS